jgi:AraC family transcriptional regulator, regulatory protein of adaptative response / methylated-DNA-[protein]-cysteine methyltransferase
MLILMQTPASQLTEQVGSNLTNRAARLSDDEKWDAVVARDDSYDAEYVFAVRSTGIYCKPSCPAKHASKEQVVFFSGPDEAEQSGFRPCKRCRPREAQSSRTRLVENVCRFIDANLGQKLTLSKIGNHAGLSPYYLQRTFKQVLGVSPREYVEARRLARMKRSLTSGQTVNDALYKAGFSSRSRIYKKTPSLGVAPGTFRRGGEGLQIEYTIIDSPLGRLLVGGTKRGVCVVSLGASDEVVEASLAQDYFAADLHRNDQALKKWSDKFMEYFADRPFNLKLPLDVQATAFQQRVWKEIQSIPYGQTSTYSKIASAIGKPKAVRAVARACATNPVSLVVPCHRVIGSDGELLGYRWGLRRKQALLIHEGMSDKRK